MRLVLVKVEQLDESFDIITRRPKPLAAYLFTNRKSLQDKFVQTVSAGGLVINDSAIHVSPPILYRITSLWGTQKLHA